MNKKMVEGFTLKGFTIDQVDMIDSVIKEKGYKLVKDDAKRPKDEKVYEYVVIEKNGSRVNITSKNLWNQIANKRTEEEAKKFIKELDEKGIMHNTKNSKTYKKLEKVKNDPR